MDKNLDNVWDGITGSSLRVAVTGYTGNVGKKLVETYNFTPLQIGEIRNPVYVKREIDAVKPDVIIHCAAMTDVDLCEENPELAFAVNVLGTKNIMDNFPKGLFIYLSTSQVFNGEKFISGYTEKHDPNPINYYGKTKWMGEEMAKMGSCKTVIVRTSRLFNYEMLKKGILTIQHYQENLEISSVIKRSFLHINHFCEDLIWLIKNNGRFPKIGLLNIAGKTTLSYYNLWWSVAREFNIDENRIIKKDHYTEDETTRPKRAGLAVDLAKHLGMPLWDAYDGIKLLKEEAK